jgi:hypothetical protein
MDLEKARGFAAERSDWQNRLNEAVPAVEIALERTTVTERLKRFYAIGQSIMLLPHHTERTDNGKDYRVFMRFGGEDDLSLSLQYWQGNEGSDCKSMIWAEWMSKAALNSQMKVETLNYEQVISASEGQTTRADLILGLIEESVTAAENRYTADLNEAWIEDQHQSIALVS